MPVMPGECISNLAIRRGGVYIDGTVGGAGHALLILDRLYGISAETQSNHGARNDIDNRNEYIGDVCGVGGVLIGIDRDETASEVARARLEARGDELGGGIRCEVVQSNYSDIDKICRRMNITEADGILLDLGISSYQIDNPDRGFSYRMDSPLDMRMDRETRLTAADIVNGYPERELTKIILSYGEERWAARIAGFISERRARTPIVTTGELVDVILAAIPKDARRSGPHPARRTFQALRIAVNDELCGLAETIKKSAALLKPGGRLCVISFHSLEDRIIKNTINELAAGCVCPKDLPVCVCGGKPVLKHISRKPLRPTESELRLNPRARSAKLRVAEKIGYS